MKFFDWLISPDSIDYQAKNWKEKIYDEIKLDFVSTNLLHFQLALWDIPKSSLNLQTNNMKKWIKILGNEEQLLQVFEKGEYKGSNSQLTFLKVLVKFSNSLINNQKVCDNKKCKKTLNDNKNLSNLPKMFYVCDDCFKQENTSLNLKNKINLLNNKHKEKTEKREEKAEYKSRANNTK